jgi:hypothetical protein
VRELMIASDPAAWAALGFELTDGGFRAGSVDVRLRPGGSAGLVEWTLSGARSADLDGLPTRLAPPRTPTPATAHPNGALSIDHVVVTTPSPERTLGALAAAGLDLRRERRVDTPDGAVRQAFYRLGEVILEVVAPPQAPEGPARFWGLVFVVSDLDACAALLGDRIGAPRAAVQPGRRIATVREGAGLGVPVALMTPAPPRR